MSEQPTAVLSYARIDVQAPADKEAVLAVIEGIEQQVHAELGHNRFKLWRDVDGIKTGEKWREVLYAAIGQAHVLIVLLSRGWLNSDECWREFETFRARPELAHKTITVYPAQLRDIPLNQLTRESRDRYDALRAYQIADWRDLLQAELEGQQDAVRATLQKTAKNLANVLEHETTALSAVSGGDGCSASPEEVQKKLRLHQEECRDLCEEDLSTLQQDGRFFRRLTRSLAIDPAIDYEPDELVDECLDRLIANPQGGLNALGKLEAKSRGDEAHKSLCALIQNLTLLLLSEIEAPVLVLEGNVGGMIEIAPGNPTGLEVRAAQIDGRRLQLQEHRRADAEIPAGRFALNIVSAEAGPRPAAPANPSEVDLLARSGMRAPANREVVEQFMVKKLPLLVGVRRSPLSDDDKAELNNAFVLNRDVNETRYLAHLLGLPPILQEQSDKLAAYFRKTYQAVRIIPVDIRKWDEDVSRFSAVINTVPVVPNDQE